MSSADILLVDLTGIYLRFGLRLQSGDGAKGPGLGRLKQAADLHLTPEEREKISTILRVRSQFDRSEKTIVVQDYGVGSPSAHGAGRSIASIHKTSSIPHWWGVFLFKLVRTLRPLRILELGTNLGISASYLRTALDLNGNESLLVTIEGDPSLADIARHTLESVSTGRAEVVTGRFQDRLQEALERCGPVDMAFIDGHHEYEATLRYFEAIRPSLSPDACIVFDDVYLWSRPVRNAWKNIVARNPRAIAVDYAKLGILLFQEGGGRV